MAFELLSAQLNYLNDSAHLLALAAPGTSAYLMARCNGIMFDNELGLTEAHKRHICTACGNILLLGCAATRQLQSITPEKRRRSSKSVLEMSKKRITKAIVYKCHLCNNQTRLSLNANIPRITNSPIYQSRSQTQQATPDLSTPQSHEEQTSKIPSSALANASSRKRAKTRKQSGLQALLAKNKETGGRGPAGGFGLDLLDLMKKA